jgi:hypothetical protein
VHRPPMKSAIAEISLRERDHLVDVDVDGGIVLKLILKFGLWSGFV